MRRALTLLDSADPRYQGEGVVTSGATNMDGGQAWINWRTAYALQDRGIVRVDGFGDEASVRRLTEDEQRQVTVHA